MKPTNETTDNTTSGPNESESLSQPYGNNRVIQPTDAFKQEAETNPELIRPSISLQAENITQPVISQSETPEFQIKNNSNIPPKSGSKKKLLLVLVSFLSIIIVASGTYLIFNKKSDNTINSESQESIRKSSSPSAFEEKLSKIPKYLESVKSFTLPLYVPSDEIFSSPIIGSRTVNGEKFEYLYYGINSQFGQGLVPGSYGVSVFSLNSYFNPPNDCGLPLGDTKPTPVACVAYEGADEDMPAWSYNGQQPGSITNSSVPKSSYLTLYVKRGQGVITIQTSGSSPAELYEIVKDLILIHPLDLPVDTLLGFE